MSDLISISKFLIRLITNDSKTASVVVLHINVNVHFPQFIFIYFFHE